MVYFTTERRLNLKVVNVSLPSVCYFTAEGGLNAIAAGLSSRCLPGVCVVKVVFLVVQT